jgi:hypothetical protein
MYKQSINPNIILEIVANTNYLSKFCYEILGYLVFRVLTGQHTESPVIILGFLHGPWKSIKYGVILGHSALNILGYMVFLVFPGSNIKSE